MELKLEVGKEYVITHKRKGVFRAKLLEVVPTPRGDREDRQFLTFEIPTGPGSGQERLARVQGAPLTVTNIRPSLVTHIVVSTRSPKLPEVPKEEEKPKEESMIQGWERKLQKLFRREV